MVVKKEQDDSDIRRKEYHNTKRDKPYVYKSYSKLPLWEIADKLRKQSDELTMHRIFNRKKLKISFDNNSVTPWLGCSARYP